MSGEIELRAALIAALRADAGLAALVNQISDGQPVTASAPWLLVGDPAASSWGARGVDGIAMRLPLLATVRGDGPERVGAILTSLDDALSAVAAAVGDWRITSLRLERSRVVRSRTEWRASVDYLLRAARLA